jgi:hypothetical protein
MEYKVVDGELVILGSLREYGVYQSNTNTAIFPFFVDKLRLNAQRAHDSMIAKIYGKTGKVPKDISNLT